MSRDWRLGKPCFHAIGFRRSVRFRRGCAVLGLLSVLRLVEQGLRGGAYVAIATHDTALIEELVAFAEREGLGRDRYEIQMLYGVRPALQLEYARRGLKVLVATPYGPEWYPYLMRRLAERPANLGFFARNLVRR